MAKPEESKAYPGWECIDCGCCAGLLWGGEYPTECYDCRGAGFFYRHKKSGVLAQYPGGPFLGREGKDYYADLLDEAQLMTENEE